MNLLYPEALILSIPAVMIWYRYLWNGRFSGGLRLIVLLMLIGALSVPFIHSGAEGVDLWVLLDRSESIPDEGRADMEETMQRLRDVKPPSANLGVIEFAGNYRVTEHAGQTSASQKQVDLEKHATDLHGALKQVFSLQNPSRPTRVLALTDGRYTTRDPLPLGMWAKERSIPIDYRHEGNADVSDTSVVDLELPGTVPQGEPFQITAWIQAPVSGEVKYELKRGSKLLDRGKRTVQPGRNRWLFRDVLKASGIESYTLSISPSGRDRIPQNNRDVGAVRVRSNKKVLVVQSSVREDRFVSSLKDAGLPVVQRSVENAFHSPADLDPFRSVILENVSGSSLGRDRMVMLKNWVKNFGGSLLMTGGTRSFARGGYIASPLEEVLPVSMKLKEEKRRSTSSVAIVLDRSGSMSATVGGDMKMDLANRGAAESIDVLHPMNEISVIGVDSSAHVAVPLQQIRGDHEQITRQIMNIRPGGGGIYVRTGLEAAMNQLAGGKGATKHIILFADATDSQERSGVRKQVEKWNRAGVTVSVVGLGTSGDRHAPFLKRVAKAGKGTVHFTNNAKDLPRIFVQDVTRSIRKTFIKKQRPLVTTTHLTMLTGEKIGNPPPVGGFNMTRKKKDASVPIRVVDNDTKRPGLAVWNYGLGRAAAFTVEVDGKYTGPFRDWERYPELNTLLVRWLMAKEQDKDVSAQFEREGSIGKIRVYLNPERERAVTGSEPHVFLSTPGAGGKNVPLEWSGPDQLSATVPLTKKGIYIGAVNLGNKRYVELPPVGLGYSPEFRPTGVGDGRSGTDSELLSKLAEVSGGTKRINLKQAFDTSRTGLVRWSLHVPLFLIALLLFLVEIASRRLYLLEHLYSSSVGRVLRRAPGTVLRTLTRFFSRSDSHSGGRDRERKQPSQSPEPSGADLSTDSGSEKEAHSEEDSNDDTGDVFDRAKERARRRMDGDND